MRKYDVYGIGNALVDTEFEVEESFLKKHKVEKGLMTLVDDARQAYLAGLIDGERVKKQSGGSAANTVIAVNQFGGKSFYSCKVANDDYGRFYMNDLKESGIQTNLNGDELPAGTTGKCLVMVTPDADRTMNTFLGISSSLDASVLNEEALANAKYLYLEGYLVTSEQGVEAMIKAKRLAEKHGVFTSITLSDPSIVEFFKPQFEKVIGAGVDLLFCNEDEALKYTATNSLLEAREKMKFIARRFAITLGKNGVIIFDGDTFIDIESFPVEAIDTNGAGDMFAGAFLYAITHGHSYAQAGKIASLAASKVVSKFGPRLNPEQIKEIIDHLARPINL
jgi:sugar/nucleoside kinase (ribokinase family)